MRKRVAFIYLPHPWLKEPEAQLPLGIMYLAAITSEKYDTSIVNLTSEKTVFDALKKLPDADFYGVTCTSLEVPIANAFGEALKVLKPECHLLIGGPGACTPEYISHAYDIICIGEAENDICALLEICEYRKKPEGRYIWTCTSEVNLGSLPLPARDMVHGPLGGNIFAYHKHYQDGETTTIMSSRGCPFHCSFCAATGKKVRQRSVYSVINEMKFIQSRYGIRQFRFSDDLFTMNKSWVMTFCEEVQNSFGSSIAWRVSARVKPLDSEMVSMMVAAGCKEFSLGVESFDDDVLSLLNKGATAEDNMKAIRMVHDAGGIPRVLLMIRTPGQTYCTTEKNRKALESVPYGIIACSSYAPLPGSEVWNNPDKFRIRILSRNLEDYNFYFYSSSGRNKIKRLFEYLDVDTGVITQQSEEFRSYLEETNKLNKG